MDFKPFPSLDTPRLHLRQLLHKDAPALLALRSDETVNKYIDRPPTNTIDQVNAFIEKINSLIAANESLYWVICLQNENELIGTICLWNFSDDKTTAEIGYELMPAFQSKGLMNEALQAVIGFTKSIQLTALEAFTHKENESSKRLLKKNGFALTGRADEENEDVIVMRLNH